MERATESIDMPDEALTGELRAALEKRDAELRRMIAQEHERATVELMSDLEGVVGDEVDRAFAKTRAGVETELVDRHLRELGGIEAARERINAGTFGMCPDCGLPIAAARLRANPAALRCTECQARQEKSFAEVR
jgi:RNA polymerase-binding transcription factor